MITLKQQKEIEKAKALLKSYGYFTDNIWHIQDVQDKFECSDEDAYSILKKALANDETYNQIWMSIDWAIGEYKD
jgi:hypothetical protein